MQQATSHIRLKIHSQSAVHPDSQDRIMVNVQTTSTRITAFSASGQAPVGKTAGTPVKLPLQTTRRHKPQLNCLKSQNPSLNENEAGGCYFPIVPIFPKTSSDQYKTVIFGLGKYWKTGEARSLKVSRQRCPLRRNTDQSSLWV